MATLSIASRLSPESKQKLAHLLKVYGAHRPAVQRLLNLTFIGYILGATYVGLSGGMVSSKKEGRTKKGKGGISGKSERVAVCISDNCTRNLLTFKDR